MSDSFSHIEKINTFSKLETAAFHNKIETERE